MSRPAAPVLEYSTTSIRDLPRFWWWSAVLLAALPIGAVLSVHAVYEMEWVVNGEQPIPPHHGPADSLEAAFYNVSGVLLLLFPFWLVPAIVLHFARPMGPRHIAPVLFLPLASWVASLIILMVDPVGAMYFWLD